MAGQAAAETAAKAWEWWEYVVAWTSFGASLAAIITGGVAVWLWLRLKGDDKSRVKRLEDYLREERLAGGDYQKSALYLVARVAMSETQLFEAARNSKHVRLVTRHGDDNVTNLIFFEYTTGDETADFDMFDRKQ